MVRKVFVGVSFVGGVDRFLFAVFRSRGRA